jgi:aryl-phospho-beta-D-glucosidase BglC (GH1 family)
LAVFSRAGIPCHSAGEAKKEQNKGESKVQKAIPRWQGFNVLEMFTMRSSDDWVEDDFRWIRDLGFDFVRLPQTEEIPLNAWEVRSRILKP